MNELIKSMLPVGAGFAPNYRTGVIIYLLTGAIDGFAIAFHIALLKVGGKSVQVLIVRQNGLTAGAKKLVYQIPNKAMVTGIFWWKGWVLKCSSMWLAPSSNC